MYFPKIPHYMNFNYTLSIFYVTLCMFPELKYWKVIVIERKEISTILILKSYSKPCTVQDAEKINL